jgi:hypothetical protein
VQNLGSYSTHIGGRKGTSSGGSGNLVGQDLITDGLQIGIGEDESNVALDVGKKTLVLWVVGLETLDGSADLICVRLDPRWILCSNVAYHGVLAHQDNTLATERVTNLVHLLRADIVDGDNENAPVLVEEALELIEIAGLVV